MKYADGQKKLEAARKKIAKLREEMGEVSKDVEPEAVEDYQLATTNGSVKLSELFGDKDDLIVIHNMGASCPACTMWADSFNGILDHLQARAAFVVVSPDAPAAQQKFAAGRGWRFPMASHQGTDFAEHMGYRSKEGKWRPGVSAFRKEGGKVVRVNDTGLGPYDDFCAAWHLFALLPDGTKEWWPKFKY